MLGDPVTRIPPSAEPSGDTPPTTDDIKTGHAAESSIRVVVPLHAEDSLASFESEGALARRERTRTPPVPRPVRPAPVERGWSVPTWLWGVVGVAVILQAGAFAWWMTGGAMPWAAAPAAARLTVTSDPPGEPVTVDGAGVGATPLSIEAAPGRRLVVVGEGPGARSHQVDVQAGSVSTVHLALTAPAASAAPAPPATGSLRIATEPPGADVLVDGQPSGRTPVDVSNLSAGEHQVRVTRAGRSVQRSVTVDAGATASLVIAMGGGIESGWLTVSSPVAADVTEGGASVGRTDMPRLLLPVGSHDLEFVNDALGYRERRTVVIAAGRTAALQLPAVNGVLNVNAQPWAEVWLDGNRIGETPVGNYVLPIGQHELVLRHPQLGERRQSIVIGLGAPARIGVDLRR